MIGKGISEVKVNRCTVLSVYFYGIITNRSANYITECAAVNGCNVCTFKRLRNSVESKNGYTALHTFNFQMRCFVVAPIRQI